MFNTGESKLVSGLFKIVCATCPAHAVVHASVPYQDGLVIHYECHGKQYLAAFRPVFTRTVVHGTERYAYAFFVQKPDVSNLREPIECIHVLDTELDPLSPKEVAEMRDNLAKHLPPEGAPRPLGFSKYNDDEWTLVLRDGHEALKLLTRFTEVA